jgi:transcriptional regulator with XRE-family HTH domain
MGMETSGDRLRRAREKAGFKSARAAAIAHGWNPSTYASHENGQTQVPIDAAKIYAKAFKANASWIVLGDLEDQLGSGLAGLQATLAEQIEKEAAAHADAFPSNAPYLQKIDNRLREVADMIARLQKEADELLIAKQVLGRFLDKP